MTNITGARTAAIARRAAHYVQLYQNILGLDAYTLAAKAFPTRSNLANVHEHVSDFAHLVVLDIHRKDWGIRPYPPINLARTMPLFRSLDVRTAVSGTILDGYPSWLWHVSAGQYAAVLDATRIEGILRRTKANLAFEEAVWRLYMHELGHLVLHGSLLFGGRLGMAIPSEPQMESEAWIFASVVLGMACGDRGCTARLVHGMADFGFLFLNWNY